MVAPPLPILKKSFMASGYRLMSYPVESICGCRSASWSMNRFSPSTPTGPMMSGALPAAICVLRMLAATLLS